MIEEIGRHERMIALRMRFRQTYIFIHIEGDDMLERNLAFFYRLYQIGIQDVYKRQGNGRHRALRRANPLGQCRHLQATGG